MSKVRTNLLGRRIGQREILSYIGRRGNIDYWRYRCDCGNEGEISTSSFVWTGSTKCFKCSRLVKRVKHDYKHPLYKIWIAFRARCNNPKDAAYENYGGRGVRVCDRWENNYQSFYDWCISSGWKKGLFVDKDTRGDGMLYSPELCAIVTRAQNNQARRVVKLSYEICEKIRASSLRVVQLCELYGVSESTIYYVRAYKTWKI